MAFWRISVKPWASTVLGVLLAIGSTVLSGSMAQSSQPLLAPNSAVPLVPAAVLRATDLIDLRQFELAQQLIDQGLAERPRDAQWRFLQAVLFAQTSQTSEAIAAFESLTQDFPELSEPHNNLAVLYLRQGQPQQARQALEQAIRNRPDYALAYENLGDLYVQLAQQAYDRGRRAVSPTDFMRAKYDHLQNMPSSKGLIPVVNTLRTARKDKSMVEFQTSMGTFTVELNAEKAPQTVENFLAYVKDGHFDGTVFHRVISGFMIQGGGFDEAMSQKPTKPPIQNEANNGLKNIAYSLAMARTNDPHSATAQFFINVVDNRFLDHQSPTPTGWGYAVFGQVVKGKEVVDKIKAVKTGQKAGHSDVPIEPVVIRSAKLLN